MGREGGRTGRTHLMVGATGLSMAETLTVVAMHNAVELSAMKSFDVAPEEQQQECQWMPHVMSFLCRGNSEYIGKYYKYAKI